MYLDDYATCAETFAALRFEHPDLDPDAISRYMNVSSTLDWPRGAILQVHGGDPTVKDAGVWFLSTPEDLQSEDVRRHIDWLLDVAEPKASIIRRLQTEGYCTSVACHWISRWGYGGPMLSPRQMARLAKLGLQLRLDFYELQESPEQEDSAPVIP